MRSKGKAQLVFNLSYVHMLTADWLRGVQSDYSCYKTILHRGKLCCLATIKSTYWRWITPTVCSALWWWSDRWEENLYLLPRKQQFSSSIFYFSLCRFLFFYTHWLTAQERFLKTETQSSKVIPLHFRVLHLWDYIGGFCLAMFQIRRPHGVHPVDLIHLREWPKLHF